MMEFHFIRPLWLLSLLPLLVLIWFVLRQTSTLTAWSNVCDVHLLPYLIQTKKHSRHIFSRLLLIMSVVFMIISLAGPTWSRLPVPTYQQIQPRVVILDMSDTMLMRDLTPDRLSRAKFKLHDLFMHQGVGQFGLVVYTDEPFVVSPLTDDGQTIDALLSSLTPDIMPVQGQQLASALEQAGQLITQAGFQQGQIVVLTASIPSMAAIAAAKTLSHAGIYTSVIPVLSHEIAHDPLFQQLAVAGQGKLIPFSDTSTDLEQWLSASRGNPHYIENLQNEIPVWRDQGRWFLIPSLIFLLPVFRRGWLQRINT
jgi:Ca-activated chloride channel family protein